MTQVFEQRNNSQKPNRYNETIQPHDNKNILRHLILE